MNTSTLSLHSFHCLHRDDLFFVLILSSFLSHNNYLRVFFLFFCYINNCPTRCNTKQPIYYSASSFYMFRVSTTPIIRSTQNCNYSLRYCAAASLQRSQASLARLEGGNCTVPEAVVTVLCIPDDGWREGEVPEAVVTVLCTPDTGGCSYSFVYS